MALVKGALFQLLDSEIVDKLTAFPHDFSLNLSNNNPPPLFGMEHRGMDLVQRSVKEGFDDLKVNIQRHADFVVVGISDNREMTKENKQLVDYVGDIYLHTHSFGQIGLVKPLS